MIYCLIDSQEYVRSNCYQHQLSKTLDSRINVAYITLADLRRWRPKSTDIIFSRLRFRHLVSNFQQLASLIPSEARLFIYDQDPWENFLTSSPNRDFYSRVAETFTNTTFLLTSTWWTELVKSSGIDARFVQMWMLPEYCDVYDEWSDRPFDVTFCGTIRPYRRKFFDELAAHGVNVQVIPNNRDYASYLKLVSRCKIMIRSEIVDWEIVKPSGETVTINEPNALWIRDVECAARGCFTMRNNDPEMIAWGLDMVPCVIPFTNARECAENVRAMLALSDEMALEMLHESSNAIKHARGWQTVVDVIEQGTSM